MIYIMKRNSYLGNLLIFNYKIKRELSLRGRLGENPSWLTPLISSKNRKIFYFQDVTNMEGYGIRIAHMEIVEQVLWLKEGIPMMRRILIVDDNASLAITLAITLQMVLQDDGFEVVTANNGNDGYSAYLQANPDLVITDMHMPGKSGPELMKNIRQHDPDAKAIYMSGDWSQFQVFLDEEKKRRKTIFLRKPFSLPELMQGVKVQLASEGKDTSVSAASRYGRSFGSVSLSSANG